DGYMVSTDKSANYGDDAYFMYYGKSNVTGQFISQAKFRIPEIHNGARYLPVTFKRDADSPKSTQLIRTVTAIGQADGTAKLFAVNPNLSDVTDTTTHTFDDVVLESAEGQDAIINQNTWYTMKITVNMDDDPATFSTYTAVILDEAGNEIAKAGPYQFGAHAVNGYSTPRFQLTSVYMLAYGGIIRKSDDTTNATLEIDDVYAKYLESATYTSTVANGAENVDVNSNVVLTFSKEMNPDSFGGVIVYEGNVEDKIICQTTKTYNENDKTLTIAPLSTFKYGRTYTVVIPNKVADAEGVTLKKSQISFTTETIPTDGVTISTPSITGTVVANGVVNGAVTFTKNNFDTNEDLTFMAVAYDENGTKVGIGYIEDNFAESDNVTLNFNFTIPSTAVGTGEIKLLVWDSFETMKPVATEKIWPAN
ncbi:MAG: Ig-like domain-containing protein, partial [Clostridia bacterium]|nr:Ig-like domain-containing protein [Clostridia bacterium]